MEISMKNHLESIIKNHPITEDKLQLPDIKLQPESIKVIMINEVPPLNPEDYFYSNSLNPEYMKTTLSLFQTAGVNVSNIQDIINMGIYITTAVKSPKNEYTVSTQTISNHLPILEEELNTFPNLKVIMLMGDVGKKAFNLISKKNTRKNTIPSGSTYKLRNNEFFYKNVRVFPSYIMTGGNILIEKSKCAMISEDIRNMIQLL